MTNSIADLEEAKAFFIIGSNTTETHPVISYRIRRARKRGAALIVADPRKIDLAKDAHVFLQIRPGTNSALLLAMAKVIVEEKLYQEEFISQWCEGFDAYISSLRSMDLDELAQITSVSREKIQEAARIYAQKSPAAILYAMGITQHSHGTDNVLALANLALLTGNLGKRGGGVNPLRGQNNVQGACDMGALPNVYPGYQSVASEEIQRKFEKAYGTNLSNEPGLTLTEMFKKAQEGSLKTLYVMGENPVMSEAYSEKTKAALKKLEFLVVQDIFLTETAQFAQVILPAASFAEKDGTFVNTERRIQRIRKAINPPGEAKADWEILSQLAKRLGMDDFVYDGPQDIMKEIASLVPNWGGISYERLEKDDLCWPCKDVEDPGTPILYTQGFLRPGGRAQFVPVSYQPPQETPDEEYPFILTTGRVLYHYHTGTMTRKSIGLTALHDRERVLMSPRDAERLKLEKGDRIRVVSRRGQVEAEVDPVPEIQEGTIFMTFHFAEACANALTNTQLDVVAKIPELKVCAVRVESA